MNAPQVVLHSSFSAQNITFREPKVLNNGGKMVQLGYNGERLLLQLPRMVLPYGISVYEDPNSGIKKYHIDLSFRGEDEDERLAAFHQALEELDQHMINAGVENSQLWFKKKVSKEVMSEFYTPVLKKSKDKETGEPNGLYPDTMKVKINYKNELDQFVCKLFDETTREEIHTPPDVLLTKGARMTALIACNGVWFAGGRYGLSWRLEQGKVSVPRKLTGYSFLDEDQVSGQVAAAAAGAGNAAEEDDGEETDGMEDEEEEPEPTPAPKTTRRRKVVRRSKATA